MEEAADPGRWLQRVDGLAVVRERVDKRRDEAGDFLGDLARRVEFMGESPIA
jgi:hypothetical protein